MPTNGGRRTPASGKPPKPLVSSGSQGKPSVNLVSVGGHITSPTNPTSSSSQKDQKLPEDPDSPSNKPSSKLKNTFQSSSNLAGHPLYQKVQSLPEDLRPFLRHDWETNQQYKLTKLKYYHILHHFDPETKARPSKTKNDLKNMFKSDLEAKLLPFIISAPSEDAIMQAMPSLPDFHPLNRRTTIAMLANTIQSGHPNVTISLTALKEEVLALYKHYVDPHLKIPQTSPFSKKPKMVKLEVAQKYTIQELRHMLQCHSPQIFLNYPVLRHQHFLSLYRAFVLDEDKDDDEEDLVEGYHYWRIAD